MDKELLSVAVTQDSLFTAVGKTYDFDEECHRGFPELLVESLENMHKHGQKSEMKAFE